MKQGPAKNTMYKCYLGQFKKITFPTLAKDKN